jgi:hypothetical protein
MQVLPRCCVVTPVRRRGPGSCRTAQRRAGCSQRTRQPAPPDVLAGHPVACATAAINTAQHSAHRARKPKPAKCEGGTWLSGVCCMRMRRAARPRRHAHDDRVHRRELGKELVATSESLMALVSGLHQREASPAGACARGHPSEKETRKDHIRQRFESSRQTGHATHAGPVAGRASPRTSVAGASKARVRDQLVAVLVRRAVDQLCAARNTERGRQSASWALLTPAREGEVRAWRAEAHGSWPWACRSRVRPRRPPRRRSGWCAGGTSGPSR